MEYNEKLDKIIENQELLIAMLHDLKQAQPTLNVAEVSKIADIKEYNVGG